MPLTPFHLGPGLALGMIFRKYINIPAILLASVIVDIRAIYLALIVGDWSNLHGFFHTFAGATVLGLVVISLILIFRDYLSKFSEILKVEQDYSLQSIAAGALIGIWVHIILDSYMHRDMTPFLPFFDGNPLHGEMFGGWGVMVICCLGFLIGGSIYVWRLIKHS